MGLSWMAWTPETAAFFIFILLALVTMGIWEWRSPGGSPRRGILGPFRKTIKTHNLFSLFRFLQIAIVI